MDFNKNKKAFKFDTLSESMSVWEYFNNSIILKKTGIHC